MSTYSKKIGRTGGGEGVEGGKRGRTEAFLATVGLGVSDFVYRIFALLVSVRFAHFVYRIIAL